MYIDNNNPPETVVSMTGQWASEIFKWLVAANDFEFNSDPEGEIKALMIARDFAIIKMTDIQNKKTKEILKKCETSFKEYRDYAFNYQNNKLDKLGYDFKPPKKIFDDLKELKEEIITILKPHFDEI